MNWTVVLNFSPSSPTTPPSTVSLASGQPRPDHGGREPGTRAVPPLAQFADDATLDGSERVSAAAYLASADQVPDGGTERLSAFADDASRRLIRLQRQGPAPSCVTA
jgi:hypothetical protein